MTQVSMSAYKNLCLPAKFYFLVQTTYISLLSLAYAVVVFVLVRGGFMKEASTFLMYVVPSILLGFGMIVGMTWLFNFICQRESVHIAWIVLICLYGFGLLSYSISAYMFKQSRPVFLVGAVVLLMVMTAAFVIMEEMESRDKKSNQILN